MSYRSTLLAMMGFDFESKLIGVGAVAPPPVCLGLAMRDDQQGGQMKSMVVADGDAEFWPTIIATLEKCAARKIALVGQTIHFDMGLIANARPDLLTLIFSCYAVGGIFDTELREKLLNLTTTGQLQYMTAPDGEEMYVRYRLEDMVRNRLGRDRSGEKHDEDSWRLQFGALSGRKAAEYPPAALEYVAQDAIDVVLVAEQQDLSVESPDGGPASLQTQEFHAGVAFCLQLMTITGFPLDANEFIALEQRVAAELTDEKIGLLYDAGVLRRPIAPKEYRGGLTKGKKATLDTKKMAELIQEVCKTHGIEVKETKTGGTSRAEEFIAELAPLHPVLQQYVTRQKVQKLVTTELPRMRNPDGTIAVRVHPKFDVLKATGRTSSYADKLFPSCNIQNIDPRARGAYVPDEGWLLLSTDISGAELVSWGWKCKQVLGHSVIFDLLNSGGDAHAFLGAQIAYVQHEGFRAACDANGADDKVKRYEYFRSCKKTSDAEIEKFYRKYRKVAKPTGLGYPGGLGPKKFTEFARKSPYFMHFTLDEAKMLRELWKATYPEAQPYFDWITSNCPDPRNPILGYGENGRAINGHAYFSPMGMYRAGCAYTDACNGAGLQTPTAEGAKLAVWEITRACYDPTYRSILYGCKFLAFIHDEVILMVPRDGWEHERALEVSRIMSHAVGTIFTGAVIRTEPALMERWNKLAEPRYDANGRLTLWTPDPS